MMKIVGRKLPSGFACVMAALFAAAAFAADVRPNVVVILADDLGYSDPGCYGSEIETPNLDRLAANGLRYTQFYNTARCWPTRAALLTGYYPQQIRRDALPTVPGGSAAKFRRPEWAPLLPHLLKPQGYRSYYSGKWHIDGTPAEGGFEGGYELHDQGRYFRAANHEEDGQRLPAAQDADGYYSTIAIAEHAIRCLREHETAHATDPFFQYVAFTAPHFPLQALPQDIAKYADRYKAGWEKARTARFERMMATGLITGQLSPFERSLGPPYPFPDQVKILGPNEVILPTPWDELTEGQQEFQAAKMAIHAAMVDRMDQEIGRIIAQLQAMSALDNTLILFLSDNGASAEIMVRGDGHDPTAAPGSAATHLCLGPGWSTVCNTPHRRHKTWVHEGGISTPLIAHWPAGIKARGDLRHNAGHVIDIVPTVLELANAVRPEQGDASAGPKPPGLSLVPSFESDGAVQHESLWWLHEGNRALRKDKWKIVAAKDEPWALYDLATDRAEQHDLAETHTATLQAMADTWDEMTNSFTKLNAEKGPRN